MKKIFLFFALLLVILGANLDANKVDVEGLEAELSHTRALVADIVADDVYVLEELDFLLSEWNEYFLESQGAWRIDLLLKALTYGAEKHDGQVRKNELQEPYIVHPYRVARVLWEQGGIRSSNVLIAAVLHDSLEDTSATFAELSEMFGERVAITVSELTNDPDLDTEANKRRQVEHAPDMTMDAQLVKLADRINNLWDLNRCPPEAWSAEKVDSYFVWGLKLARAVKGAHPVLEQSLQNEVDQHFAN